MSYDAVIIGAGHNGLVCAAYLARAGKRVLVLERRERVGGAAVTEEIFPGFKFSVYSYVVSLLRPEIIRDLDLPRHGLHVLPLESTLTPLHEGEGGRLPRAVGRSRPEPPRAGAALAARRRGVRRVRAAHAPDGARGEAAARRWRRPIRLRSRPRDLAGLGAARRAFPRPRVARISTRCRKLHDDELGRLPRRVVRDRGAQGDQVRERHHRHPARTALAGDRVRAAAPLHGRDRRGVPRLGIREGRQRLGERRDRGRGAGGGRGDPHERAGSCACWSRTAARRGVVLESGEEIRARLVVSNADPAAHVPRAGRARSTCPTISSRASGASGSAAPPPR